MKPVLTKYYSYKVAVRGFPWAIPINFKGPANLTEEQIQKYIQERINEGFKDKEYLLS